MGTSTTQEKLSKRQKAAVFFNNLFRTKLEIDSDKLAQMMQASNENEVRGDTTFYYSRGKLQSGIEERLGGKPKYVQLTELSVSYWCDIPKSLWIKFQDDSVFIQQLYDHVNELTEKLVSEWAKRAKVWERSATEADGKGDTAGIQHAISEFQKDCVALQSECEKVAIEDIANFFQSKVKTFSDYKSYKVKAGAKLTFTFVGIIISVAALSTAATPAAPATLVPALIGLVSAVGSATKQIKDLSDSAEEIAKELEKSLTKLEVSYRDEKGKPKKAKYRANDLAAGFVSGMSGGWSDAVFPSVKGLMGSTDTHRSKVDGLEVKLHEMGNNLNAMADGLGPAQKVLQDNLDALNDLLKKKPGNKELAKAQKALGESQKVFGDLNTKFVMSFNVKIPEMIKRVTEGSEKNAIWKEKLEAINKALGSKNWATVGNLFATLALTGIGFASGLPSNFAESVTTPLGGSFTALDTLREYTPEVMEKMRT